jgi:hypothetical protein
VRIQVTVVISRATVELLVEADEVHPVDAIRLRQLPEPLLVMIEAVQEDINQQSQVIRDHPLMRPLTIVAALQRDIAHLSQLAEALLQISSTPAAPPEGIAPHSRDTQEAPPQITKAICQEDPPHELQLTDHPATTEELHQPDTGHLRRYI